MNVESLKSELQQVLDNDVVLRKEFNGLKRSLSDYRNQLIMRDEDCKRLQVTIDVLNTKLVVMERDNTTYKAELSSFKELRGTIKDQLQAKQDEIEARLLEIQGLRDDLNTMAASYETKLEELRNEAGLELERVTGNLHAQIAELRNSNHYKESGIKEEYENRVSELTIGWADKEQSLVMNHEEEIHRLKENHAAEVLSIKEEATLQLNSRIQSSEEELQNLITSHTTLLNQKEEEHSQKIAALDEAYRHEVATLRTALEEQRSTLTTNFNAQIEHLKAEFSSKEAELTSQYERQIEALSTGQGATLAETVAGYELKITALVNEYEEKLSHTLIHSTSQNSKLNEELGKAQSEQETHIEKLTSLAAELELKTSEIADLSTRLSEQENLAKTETEKSALLNSEFESFKQQALFSGSEQVNELNQQIVTLNSVHSEYVNELSAQIEGLNTELRNLGLLLESTTNNLSETENGLALKTQELEEAQKTIDELNLKLGSFDATLEGKEQEVEDYKRELEQRVSAELKDKTLEYNKLLAENTNLIEEIDSAQDKVEAQEQEISMLKGELEEAKLQSLGKSEYFKETLSNRNFEITNLEANNAALSQEIINLKNELAQLQTTTVEGTKLEEEMNVLQEKLNLTSSQNVQLGLELEALQTTIVALNKKGEEMNTLLQNYETEIGNLKTNVKNEEQDAFIDRLFKQIDELNNQRLALLDEKEQMAVQLLKMNDVVGNLSQQVDSEKIDVSSLNNHRKNVILANNSEETPGKSPMKEQINDLVREIDKCIALLSA